MKSVRADGELVGIDGHGNQVTDDSTNEIEEHELANTELLFHTESDTKLEEDVEEQMHHVRVQHRRQNQAPELSGGDGGAPTSSQEVERASVRCGAGLTDDHRENELGTLGHGDLPDEGGAVETGEHEVGEAVLCLLTSSGVTDLKSRWGGTHLRRHLHTGANLKRICLNFD